MNKDQDEQAAVRAAAAKAHRFLVKKVAVPPRISWRTVDPLSLILK